MSQQATHTNSTANNMGVLISTALMFLVFQSTVSVLPIYVIDQYKATTSEVGLMLTVFAMAALSSRPLGGPLMHKLGEKRAYIGALVLFAIASALIGTANSMGALLAFRAIQGFALGVSTSAGGTLIASNSSSENMNMAMAQFAMAINLPLVVGPYLGNLVVQHYGYPLYFGICVVTGVLSALVGLTTHVAHNPVPAAAAPKDPTTPEEASSVLDRFIERSAVPVAMNVLIIGICNSAILAFATVYAKEIGLLPLAGFFFGVHALMFSFSRPLFGWFFNRIGETATLYLGIVLIIAGFLVMGLLHTSISYLGSAGILGVGYGILFPTFQSLIMRMAPAGRTGFANSTFFLFMDSGVTLGSFTMGMVAERAGLSGMYILAAAVSTAMFVLFTRARRAPGYPA